MTTNDKSREHNPDHLTPEQVGVSEGWRLLDEDEVTDDEQSDRRLDEIEFLKNKQWDDTGWHGSESIATYRTKLTRAELRQARGLEVQRLREENDTLSKTVASFQEQREEWDALHDSFVSDIDDLRAMLTAVEAERDRMRDQLGKIDALLAIIRENGNTRVGFDEYLEKWASEGLGE